MESSTITRASLPAADAPTLTEALRRTAAANPQVVAVRTLDGSVSISWGELLGRIDALAAGLASLGAGRGQTVAIMLSNRPEFTLVDLAISTAGATPFSIYLTYPVEEIVYLCTHAQTRIAVVEQAYLERLLAARRELPRLEHVIVVDGDAPAGTIALTDLEQAHAGFDGGALAAQVAVDDIATLIYTSGTTGRPKGVQLSHRNIMAAAHSVQELIPLAPGSRLISWLPAAHIAERMSHLYIPTVYACTVTTCHDPRQILDYLPRVHPNWFFAVPRIWEKLKAGVDVRLAAMGEAERTGFEQALAASLERVRLRQGRAEVPAELAERVAAADAELFAPLRERLGLDQVITVNVGAAPTPPAVVEFFHAIGIELAELWGMSETCGVGSSNRIGEVRIGTVGPPGPGSELRIAPDGELLCRGGFVTVGYRGSPEATREAIDADGWLHTGDIGSIDEDGYLRIVDRKKELIINSSGKNMSPANIEATIKTSSPLIGQACCIGDRRHYNTALIVLDADYAPQWGLSHGFDGAGLAELSRQRETIDAVAEGIAGANRHLSRTEQIKRFWIVPGEWLPGGDELTPTMKLKRRPIAEKYAAEIEAMYAG